VQLASSLLDKKGDTDAAIRFITELVKEWSGVPGLVADPYLSLAQLEIKQGRKDDAIKSLTKILTLMEDSQKVPVDVHLKSLQLLGEIYADKGDKANTAKVYEQMLTKYGANKPLASYRYKLGKIQFEQGDVKKAEETWADLKNEKTETWYRLAQEHLKEAKWKDEYQKYIKRIPAMSNEQSNTERKNQ
jgi:tetratricopeptide (TPR) repeat protein